MTENSKKSVKNLPVLKKCFFITPIGDSKSNEFEKLEGLIENVLNPVLEEKGYEIIVAHKIQTLGSINDQIFKSIIDSDLIISNLTGLNANVMYETAVAHSFGKPTIMISETGTVLPFDLKTDRIIFFSDSIQGTGLLKKEILGKITQLESDKNTDNPIVRVIESSKLNELLSKDNLSEDETLMKMIFDLSRKIDRLDKVSNYDNYFNSSNTSGIRYVRILFNINRNQIDDLNKRFEQLLNYNGILKVDLINIRNMDSPEIVPKVILEIFTSIDNNSLIEETIESCFGQIYNLRIRDKTPN